MTSAEGLGGNNENSLEKQMEAVFANSREAATFADFLEDVESGEPLTDQDFEEINQAILQAQAPIIRFVAEAIPDKVMKSILSKMADPQNTVSCSEMAAKLQAIYQHAYPGLPPDELVLRDIAVFDMIEDITDYIRPVSGFHLEKSEIQSKILINPRLDATFKQVLLAATDTLVPGEGIDFSDPAAAFSTVEKKAAEERSRDKSYAFRRLFREFGKTHNVEHAPNFTYSQ